MTGRPEPAWQDLTVLPAKRRLYADDGFFREGWADICHVAPGPVEPLLHGSALVLYKPEAIGGRKVTLANRLLAERGFAVVAAIPLEFSGAAIHGLWRYQLRRNTLDKIRLYTRWATRVRSILVAYRDLAPIADIPAAVRLKSLKGPAAVGRRQPDDLRTLLGSPNSILNFLHSADEPADVVRELAVLLPAQDRDAFTAKLIAGDVRAGATELDRHIRSAERRIEAHDVEPAASAKRLLRFIRTNSGIDAIAARRAQEIIDLCLSGATSLDLRLLEDSLLRLGSPDPLDIFAFGTQFIDHNIEGHMGELDEDCVPIWRARAAGATDGLIHV